MQKINIFFSVLFLVFLFSCSSSTTGVKGHATDIKLLTGEAEILQSWQGDYPVSQLDLLLEVQEQQGLGFVNDAETFKSVWKAFKPGEDVPEIDFTINLVLYARNTQFFNRIRIGKVTAMNGVAELIAMETLSAMPIEDKVAISFIVVHRQGIVAIKARDGNILIVK